jgi:chromosome segregation ATPase
MLQPQQPGLMPMMNVISPRHIRRSPQGLVTKSWRQDQEAVCHEINEIRKQLEAQEEQLIRKEKSMEAEQKDIKAQHDDLHSAEATLSSEMADLARRRESFEVEYTKKKKRLDEERAILDKDRATLAQLDKYLAAKEKKLANANDLSSTATESTSNLSRSIEASLQDERKWIDKAAAAISESEDELECKELALRQSQASISVLKKSVSQQNWPIVNKRKLAFTPWPNI